MRPPGKDFEAPRMGELSYCMGSGNLEVLEHRLIPSEIMSFVVDLRTAAITSQITGLAAFVEDGDIASNTARFMLKLPAAQSVEYF
jgi:hypothetical protein